MDRPDRHARAKQELEAAIAGLGTLRNASTRDPNFKQWRQNTLTLVQRLWPADQTRSERFRRIPFSPPSARANARTLREFYERGCAEALTYLRGLVAEVGQAGPGGQAAQPPTSDAELQDAQYPAVELPPTETEPPTVPRAPAKPVPAPPAAKSPPVATPPTAKPAFIPPSAKAVPAPAPPAAKPAAAPPSAKAAPAPAAPATKPAAAPPSAKATPTPAAPAAKPVPAPPGAKPTPGPSARRAPSEPGAATGAAHRGKHPSVENGKRARGKPPMRLKEMLGLDDLERGEREATGPAGTVLPSMPAQPEAEARREEAEPPTPPPPAGAAREPDEPATEAESITEPDDSSGEMAERFLSASPIFARPAAGEEVQGEPEEPAEGSEAGGPDEAVLWLAARVADLGVPEGRRAQMRALLTNLAQELDRPTPAWSVVAEVVSAAMEYPSLARVLLPLLLPDLERAA